MKLRFVKFILSCLKTLEISCGQRLRFCPNQKSAWNSCNLCLQIFVQSVFTAFTAQRRIIHGMIDNSWTEDILCCMVCMVQEIKHMHGRDSFYKKTMVKCDQPCGFEWVEGTPSLFYLNCSHFTLEIKMAHFTCLCYYFHFKSFHFIRHEQVSKLHGNM